MKKILIFFLIFLSCDISAPIEKEIVARVGENSLIKEDINNLVPNGLSKDDSIKILTKYIDNWALNQLIRENAELNLSEEEIEEITKLSEDYYNELLINAYKNKVAAVNSDTIVNPSDVIDYYEEFRENFKLYEDVVKGRYVKLSKNNFNLQEIKRRFRRLNDDDKSFFDSISIQLFNYSFNDSTWINKNLFFSKIPVLNDLEKERIVKNMLYLSKEDSLDVYLIKVNDYKKVDDVAPIDYIYNRIEDILLNKKKVDFIKKFEKEILENAKKDNKFQFTK